MKITIIVMPLPQGSGFKARTGEPWNITGEDADSDMAFAKVESLLRSRNADAEFVRVDVPAYDRLFDLVGTLDPNSPAWDAWSDEIQRDRLEREQAEEEVLPAGASA